MTPSGRRACFIKVATVATPAFRGEITAWQRRDAVPQPGLTAAKPGIGATIVPDVAPLHPGCADGTDRIICGKKKSGADRSRAGFSVTAAQSRS